MVFLEFLRCGLYRGFLFFTMHKIEQITGSIERITFHNEESGFIVLQLAVSGQKDLVTCVGTMPQAHPGESIKMQGQWKTHLSHGKQFTFETFQVELPHTTTAIKKYLGSGLIKGIGPKFAERIVNFFGENTLDILDTNPERLLEIQGLGKKRLRSISSCWNQLHSIRSIMLFLQSFSISPNFATRIYKAYGEKAETILRENPYALAQDMHGVGFKTADKIASQIGIPHDSPYRLRAGIFYTLEESAQNGHTCMKVEELLTQCQELLQVDTLLLQAQLSQLKEKEEVVIEKMSYGRNNALFVWSTRLYAQEKGIAIELRRLQRAASSLRAIDKQKAIEWVEKKLSIELAPNQETAVAKCLEDKVHIITGGPGTGKSTITNAILTIASKLTNDILLAAPTGKAAKRMSEITGRPAKTIHSLLEFDFRKRGFKKDRENPLQADLLIVDESSMIDTPLMYRLLRAIPDHCRLILVGDIHQLPSVGPGNVLKDILSSGCVPSTTLNQIFRQAQGSRIITNAHLINQGKFPDIHYEADSDFFFIERKEPQDVLKQIVQLIKERIPIKWGLDPVKEVQVLAPMKKGVIGTLNLNVALQEALNPKGQGVQKFGQTFKPGDKVMQLKNNYDKEVFNGDVGFVEAIDLVDQEIVVRFDDKEVSYDFLDLDEITLAYAVSIHKYQGSECPCVVIPVHTQHFMMLHRNLLYTGVTRGKKSVVLVGTKKALALAVNNDEVKERYTGLAKALQEGVA
jgi:exodeoxyribonuclease V alpha subunit